MKKMLCTLGLAVLISGCAQQTFVMSDNTNTLKDQHTEHFFVSGIGQSKMVNAAEVCGTAGNVAKVEVQQTFVNGLLGFVTFGIYTPREARVYCK